MNSKRILTICGIVALIASSVSATDIKRAARQGDARAQYELGKRYSERKSYARALSWLRKAAEQGHPGAQNRLGVMYERGEGVRIDLVEAYKWYTLAGTTGNTFGVANRISLERRLSEHSLALIRNQRTERVAITLSGLSECP